MERVGYLIVPRNREGMVGQMAGDAEPDDLLFFSMTEAEARASRPLLHAFQDAFGFDAEGAIVEQLIDTRYAGLAESIARTWADTATSEAERRAAACIADALAAALDLGSYVEFALD